MKKIIKKILVILSLICIGLLFIGKTEVKADDVDNYNINSKALYTVFTHGWNGDAGSWGSGEDSLVTRLGKLINANIYSALIYLSRISCTVPSSMSSFRALLTASRSSGVYFETPIA